MSAHVIVPGDVNAHTHLYSALVPLGVPLPQPWPHEFAEILARFWWRLDRAIDAEILSASARYGVAIALLSGTTTLIDHHESPSFIEGSLDTIADACDALGARAVLCYGATERNGGRDEARRGLAECSRFAARRATSRVRAAVGLHAGFTISDATIAEAGGTARALDLPIHVHLAESAADAESARAAGHEGAFARIADAAPRGSILAHGVTLSEAEVRIAEQEGFWLVQNPRSNASNHVGYAMALGASERVALGTDGFPSNMAEEARALAELARAQGDDRADPDARRAAGRALAAEIFGMSEIEGDFVRIRADDSGARAVDVDVGGRAVVRAGRLVGASFADIEHDAKRAAEALAKRMEDLP